MDFDIGKKLNKLLNFWFDLLNKFNSKFEIKAKIFHNANFDFTQNKFLHKFKILTKILKDEKISQSSLNDEIYFELCNLNEILLTSASNENYKFFKVKHTPFDFSYIKGDLIYPILVDDFINKEMNKLSFLNQRETSNWNEELQPEKFTILFYFSIDNPVCLNFLKFLNELYESNKNFRYIFLFASGSNSKPKISRGTEEELVFRNSYLIDLNIDTSIEFHQLEMNSYENEHLIRHEQSEKEFDFTLKIFNSVRNSLSDEVEYYFFDRRHFINEKVDLFKDGYAYLISSEGKLEKSISASISNTKYLLSSINNSINSMSFPDLPNFFKKEQKENLEDLDKIFKLISTFNFNYDKKGKILNESLDITNCFKFLLNKEELMDVYIKDFLISTNLNSELNFEFKKFLEKLNQITQNITLNETYSPLFNSKALTHLNKLLINEEIFLSHEQFLIKSLKCFNTNSGNTQKYSFELLFDKEKDYTPTLQKLYKLTQNEDLIKLFNHNFNFWKLLPILNEGDSFFPLRNLCKFNLILNNLSVDGSIENCKNCLLVFFNPFHFHQFKVIEELKEKTIINYDIYLIACGKDKFSLSMQLINCKNYLISNKYNYFLIDKESLFYTKIYKADNYLTEATICLINEKGKIEKISSKGEAILESLGKCNKEDSNNSEMDLSIKEAYGFITNFNEVIVDVCLIKRLKFNANFELEPKEYLSLIVDKVIIEEDYYDLFYKNFNKYFDSNTKVELKKSNFQLNSKNIKIFCLCNTLERALFYCYKCEIWLCLSCGFNNVCPRNKNHLLYLINATTNTELEIVTETKTEYLNCSYCGEDIQFDFPKYVDLNNTAICKSCILKDNSHTRLFKQIVY